MNKEYNIGLDIGTSSVGWAVVEAGTQKILKKGKKHTSLWGVRLFDEASSAEERRSFRSTRRRYNRRRERIKLLRAEFENEINKVDSKFFQKMHESKYRDDDLTNKRIKITLDENKAIKKFHKEFPTIYHLRKELIESKKQFDIRLVYLAMHHIIKYRGNFSFAGNDFDVDNLDLNNKFIDLISEISSRIPESNIDSNEICSLNSLDLDEIFSLKSKNDFKLNIKKVLSNITENTKFINEFVKCLNGNKFDVAKLFCLESSENKLNINIDAEVIENNISELEELLLDKIDIIYLLSNFYQSLLLKKVFVGQNTPSISNVMVERYIQHSEDLRFLKNIFNYDRILYNKLLRSSKNNNICLYDKYLKNEITNEDFVREINKYLPEALEKCGFDLQDSYNNVFKSRIENGSFLPRINDTENGIYPYQINKNELKKIIENQGVYYPFLLNKTVDGTYKIIKLLEFKIPYYVGPLNSNSKFSWLEVKKNERITPYNFDDIVNKEETAERFIKRMISHCTYLNDKKDENGNIVEINYALPNNSILYSTFKVMNELKQIRINNNKIENEIQHKIIDELFKKSNGVITEKKFKDYLYSSPDFNEYSGEFNITGYSSDKKFANNMQSYVDFFGDNGIFKDTTYSIDDAEQIIEWVTIFDDKDILENKVRNTYSLSDVAIKKVLSKKYNGWGSISKRLLCDLLVKDKVTGISKSIMDYMYETNENFMQILNNKDYNFQKEIDNYNKLNSRNLKLNYSLIEELVVSPKIKRGIYQALKIVDELIKYIGYQPNNIMIEMARDNENSGRTKSRKDFLLNLYEKNKEDISNYDFLVKSLKKEEKIDSEKLFLYFIQEGKCLYTGEPISIENINSDLYEVDHIIPRSLVKDDSIDNKALVKRECNQKKAANFVLPREYRNHSIIEWWNHLKKVGLLSVKKYNSLRREKYSPDDIKGFINRQLVETRQITKHVANIISSLYPKSKVVYIKANLSHFYRERYELYKFRELNDYHHAHDAYLAAVLGEYKEKIMKNDIDFEAVKELNRIYYEKGEYEKLKYGYVINSLDSNEFETVNKITKSFIDDTTGEIIFDPKNFNDLIENTLYRNDILVTRKTEIRSGQFYDQTIYPKGKGNIEIKKDMPVEKYGGYSSLKPSYMVLVEYKGKRKIIGIPSNIAIGNGTTKEKFIKNHLSVKENENFKILKDKIPFEVLMEYKNSLVNIVGYSVTKKNSEVSNFIQLKLNKKETKQYKHLLNIILNNKTEKIDTFKYLDECDSLLQLLLNKKYILFENEINKIREVLSKKEFEFEDYKKIIIELLKIYHCNSVNGNLKDYGLSDRIGRLSGKTLSSGKLIFTSTTGLKVSTYEF